MKSFKNWNDPKLDNLKKWEKISRNKNVKKSQDKLENTFSVSEKEWQEILNKNTSYFAARIVEVHKRYVFVSTEPTLLDIHTRDVWIATMSRTHLQTAKNERNVVSVGDRVICRPSLENETGYQSEGLPQATMEHRLKRASCLARIDPQNEEREHVLASNIDQIVVVASYIYPKVKWGLIDRYLVLAEEQNLDVVILLTKADLLKSQDKEFRKECEKHFEIYQSLDYKIYSLSALKKRKEAKIVLKKIFDQKISILSGHSGVGKSSLINLMRPEIEQDVEDEEILRKGRHTTTYASLIRLGSGGGYVIDTPGIRSFLIEERSAFDLAHAFREMRPYLGQCKYTSNCTHLSEPGCMIREMVNLEKISVDRYNSYVGLLTGSTGREGRVGVDEGDLEMEA